MPLTVLAFSSSKEGNGGYLQTAAPVIKDVIGDKPLNIAFIPFAAVTIDYGTYTTNVRNGLKGLPYSIHTVQKDNASTVIEQADVIMTGGGNTFKLLHDLHAFKLTELVQQKVKAGTPYIGWSAGSNVAGATICTSNDMPIINPGSFTALGFFPFQVNPHYYNQPVSGFNGETRDQRLAEFVQLNPGVPVVALPEGTALLLQNNHLKLIGSAGGKLMTWQHNEVVHTAIPANEKLDHLLV